MGRCRLRAVETHVESAWSQHLNVKCDGPLSRFAFYVNVRRCSKGSAASP